MGISEVIKRLRNRDGYTQKELAVALHVKPTTISGWEIGRNEPSVDMIQRMAKLFNVTTDYLLGVSSSANNDELDLIEALSAAHSFNGKPITDHDRKVVKGVLQSYFQ